MYKKFVINNKNLEVQNDTKSKKPKWINDDSTSLFQTFTQKKSKSKNQREVERKLALANLSLEKLDEMYGGVNDCLLYFHDIYGNNLWMNKLARDTFWKNEEEIYLLPIHQNWLDANKDNPTFQKKLNYVLEELPKKYELSENANTPFGEYFFKVLWVKILDLNI